MHIIAFSRLASVSTLHSFKDKIICARAHTWHQCHSSFLYAYLYAPFTQFDSEESSVISDSRWLVTRGVNILLRDVRAYRWLRCRGKCRVEIIHSLIFHRHSINVKTRTYAICSVFLRMMIYHSVTGEKICTYFIARIGNRERPKKRNFSITRRWNIICVTCTGY